MGEPAINDLELSRFPRIIPEDVFVVDTFPLHPVPERLDLIKADVLGQLALAKAPFSGKAIACILAGSNEGYGGHVIEHSTTNIEDPFMMALRKVPKGAELYGIMIAGTGAMKEKHLLPSGRAYDAIAPQLVPGSPIVVMPPNQTEVCRFIPESRHQSAYSPKPASIFSGQTAMEIYSEAIRYTTLSPEDSMFAANLRLSGLREAIHYYLTGSANGSSGPSVLLKPGMYSDLDVIAISELEKTQVQAAFENVAEAHYGVLDKTPKMVQVAGTNRIVEGCIYSNPESGISIDFYVAGRPEDAFVRQEYLERNYFHQLS